MSLPTDIPMTGTDLVAAVDQAAARIRPYVRETPLEASFPLSRPGGAAVYLKLESRQVTGSFKARGALNRLLGLTDEERSRGVVAASTGNHGLAVAYGLQALGLTGTIYLPETVAPRKVDLLRRYDAELQFYGQDPVETEQYARAEGARTGRIYVSPYNDAAVVAGQGTIGRELQRTLDGLDAVYVPVGGGGMVGGIAGYLKETGSRARIVGCQPARSPAMYACVQAGRVIDVPTEPTLSDGTAGGVEAGALTLPLCMRYVDDWVLVEEDAIRDGMKRLFDEHALVVEGAAGVAVAAYRATADRWPEGSRVALIICGGNIAPDSFRQLVSP